MKDEKHKRAWRKPCRWVGCEVPCMPFFYFCVCHPVHYDFFHCCWCERTQQSNGTAKECSLHSNKVDGCVNELMNGWMDVTKSPHVWAGAGAGHCQSTVSLFYVSHLAGFYVFFVQFYCCKRRVRSENPSDMKTVRYCFATFYLNTHFPPCRSLWSHFKSVGTTQSPFFFVCVCVFFFFNKAQTVWWRARGELKKLLSEWKLVLHKTSLLSTCITLKSPINSFPLISSQDCGKIYCEQSMGTKAETSAGNECKM